MEIIEQVVERCNILCGVTMIHRGNITVVKPCTINHNGYGAVMTHRVETEAKT